MRGRIDDLTGWILFNQDKYPDAIEHLKRATTTLPNGTPAWRNAVWHLGVAYEQTGRNDIALENYIQSYNAGPRDPIRRSVIEKLYRKVNGSVEGLEDKVGPAVSTGTAGVATKTAALPRSRIQFRQAHRKQRNHANRKRSLQSLKLKPPSLKRSGLKQL